MLIYKLADGTFMVEVPSSVNLTFNEISLLDNFQLDDIPNEAIFDADPRPLEDYLLRRSAKETGPVIEPHERN